MGAGRARAGRSRWRRSHRCVRRRGTRDLRRRSAPRAEEAARRRIDNEFGAGQWDRLTQRQREALFDFEHNGVLDEFPRFRRAVVEERWEDARVEHRRHAGGTELERCNRMFEERFIDAEDAAQQPAPEPTPEPEPEPEPESEE